MLYLFWWYIKMVQGEKHILPFYMNLSALSFVQNLNSLAFFLHFECADD